MEDYTEQWNKLTRRWANSRKIGLLHLLLVPVLIYLFSFPVRWLIGDDPVWYFIVAYAAWLVAFVYLLVRDRYYSCPRCGARVRPFGGTDMPNFHPHPCQKCGLVAPSPPYR